MLCDYKKNVCRKFCTFKVQIIEHNFTLKNWILEAPMMEHGLEKQHNMEDLCFFMAYTYENIGQNRIGTKKTLLWKEAFWIHKLNTLIPYGLNQELNLSRDI